MARNKLSDLNNHLFAQLETLRDDDTKGEILKQEIERSKAVANISKNIIENAKLVLQAAEFVAETNANNDSIKRLTE